MRLRREEEFRSKEEGLMGIILVDLKADEIEKVVEKRAIFKFYASIFGFQFLKVFVIDLEKKGSCSRRS